MKNIMITLFLFVLLFKSIFAQNILWKKNFGLNTADDFGRSVIETSDGGIAIVGYTGSFGSGGNDVWLIKTNAGGDTLWTKTYGGTNGDFGYSIKQIKDGGFIIGGATYSYGVGGADFYIIRTDSIGDTLWTKTFGEVNDDFCLSLDTLVDGYILAGKKNSNQPFKPDIWIIKIDQIGNLIWQKTYSTSGDDVAYSVDKTNDGGFIIAAEWSAVGLLMKINSLGDSLWSKSLEAGLRSVTRSDYGGYILTGAIWNGAEEVNVLLLKTDSLGNTEWEKTYDYQNDYDIGYSVQQTIDGGYIVCGSAIVDGGASFGWIIRTNDLGDTLWTQEVHSYVKSSVLSSINTTLYSVIQSSNGDYVVVGNQPILPVSDHAQQVVLLRIASDIIPVELTSFTATSEQNSVSLNWQTATETNNSGFEIERSQTSNVKGQMEWNEVGFVPGFGTTTEPKSYSFTDENLSAGKYQYRLKQIDFDGSFEYSNIVEVEVMVTKDYSLSQNYPNPFNPATLISFSIPNDEFVSLRIYDVLGREFAQIINERRSAGTYQIEFNGAALNSGVYYYTLTAGSYTETKKMMIIK